MPRRDYRLKDNTRVSGVTTIIDGNLGWSKRGLIHWAWNEGMNNRGYRKSKDDACNVGTFVHSMVEADLNGLPVPTPPIEFKDAAASAYDAFQSFRRVTNLQTIAVEEALVSERYRFGGTIDRVVTADGKTAILDLKTSNATHSDYKIQISAYGKLWEENHPDNPIKAYYLLRVDKENGGFSFSFWPSLEKEWEAFLCLLKLHELKKVID